MDSNAFGYFIIHTLSLAKLPKQEKKQTNLKNNN